MSRILIALQYWEGDRKQAESAARLIADLEPRHREDTDMLLVARYDSRVDPKLVKHVSAKFNTYTHVSPRRGMGWPSGCNDLWVGTLDYVRQMSACKRLPQYGAILTTEADSMPLRPDWLDRLHADWDAAGCFVAGALLATEPPHVNGNALFSASPFFLHRIVKTKIPVRAGWDQYLASLFKSFGWKNLPGFHSEWQRKTVAAEELERFLAAGIYFYHGVKDNSVQKFVSKKYLTRTKISEPL